MIHDAQVFEAPHSYGRAFARWYRFAQPRIGAHATRILTVSSYSRDALVRFGVAPAERIAVIPNGADHLLAMTSENTGVTQLGLVPGRYTLALATTQPHKNIAMLLRAFAMPLLSDLKLVLFGSEGHEEFAQMGTLPANVVFAGRLSDGALRGLMEQAACLAFPSRTEGFGLPPLEAMSLGCPVIAAPCGALPETCGDAALYIDPDDIEGWANTVRRLADNPIERSLLAERGRAQSAGYTWAASAGKLLDVLLEVCDG
jgi:glycosyltransferase involved in cell wall biosynthesis